MNMHTVDVLVGCEARGQSGELAIALARSDSRTVVRDPGGAVPSATASMSMLSAVSLSARRKLRSDSRAALPSGRIAVDVSTWQVSHSVEVHPPPAVIAVSCAVCSRDGIAGRPVCRSKRKNSSSIPNPLTGRPARGSLHVARTAEHDDADGGSPL